MGGKLFPFFFVFCCEWAGSGSDSDQAQIAGRAETQAQIRSCQACGTASFGLCFRFCVGRKKNKRVEPLTCFSLKREGKSFNDEGVGGIAGALTLVDGLQGSGTQLCAVVCCCCGVLMGRDELQVPSREKGAAMEGLKSTIYSGGTRRVLEMRNVEMELLLSSNGARYPLELPSHPLIPLLSSVYLFIYFHFSSAV